MIVHDMPQGSPEWERVRLGLPTASAFHKICTAKTGKFSESATCRGYAHFIIAEMLMGRSLNPLENLEWIQRGKDMEPQAVKMYEFENDLTTKPVGFITTDDGRWGATPDRLLIDVNGAVEIKCPAPQTHIGYVADGFGDDYKVQVQGQMLVGGFDFIDRYSFCPELPVPTFNFRTHRDEDYIALLRSALERFCTMRDEMLDKLRAAGWDGTIITPAVIENRELEQEIDDDQRREPLNDFGIPDDWEILFDDLRADIDRAATIDVLQAILSGPRFDDLARHRPHLAAGIRERSTSRASLILQAPDLRAPR